MVPPAKLVGLPFSLQVSGLSLSVSLKSTLSPFTAMVSTPVSCDSLKLVSFHTVGAPFPPETFFDRRVMVYGLLPSGGVMSTVLVILLPSAEISTFTLLDG